MYKTIIITLFCLITSTHAQAKGINGGVIGGAIGKLVGEASVKSNDMEKVLVETANTVNKQLPMTVNKYTRLNSTIAGPGLRYTYNHTLLDVTSKTASREVIANYIRQIQSRTTKQFCTTDKTLFLSKNGVTVTYAYYFSDDFYAGEFQVTPKDCSYAK